MGRGQAVTVAGLGCRAGCPAETVLALIAEALARVGGGRLDALATAAFKRDEPGLVAAARQLGLPLLAIESAALAAVAAACPTRSARVLAAVGQASVAEAAALAATAPRGTLILPRISNGLATCALAREEEP
nr:cobalamin biosynthesis protein [Thiococcus pfennigii]